MNYLLLYILLLSFFGIEVNAQVESSKLSDLLIEKPKNLVIPGSKVESLRNSTNEDTNVSQLVDDFLVLENEKQFSKYALAFGFVPTVQNYQLKGNGFYGTLENEYGYGVYGNLKYNFNNIHSISFLYNRSKINLFAPSTISPTDVFISRDFLVSAYHYSFSDKMIEIYSGPAYLKQAATKTSPKSLISSFSSFGFLLGVSINSATFLNSWKLKALSSFYIPVKFEEKDYSTGNYKNGIGSNIDLFFLKTINENVTISFGPRFYYESYKFSGTGNRGTVNGSINSRAVSFPIEMEYKL